MNIFNAGNKLAFGVLLLGTLAGSLHASGEETFKAKCASCHGANGGGETVMGKKFKLRDLRDPEVQKETNQEIESIIAKGKAPMPAFAKSLDAAKITELAVYIHGMGSK